MCRAWPTTMPGPRPALLLDAGTGIRRLKELLGDRPFRGSVLLTHLHWDHVQGLPFFSSGDREGTRVSLLLAGRETPRPTPRCCWRA